MWASLLNQTVDSISSISVDGYGAKTATVLHEEVKCRWQEKFQLVLNSQGAEVTSKVQCWILPTHDGSDVTIDTDYIFIYDSVSHIVIAYVYQYGLSGVHEYTKVFLQ